MLCSLLVLLVLAVLVCSGLPVLPVLVPVLVLAVLVLCVLFVLAVVVLAVLAVPVLAEAGMGPVSWLRERLKPFKLGNLVAFPSCGGMDVHPPSFSWNSSTSVNTVMSSQSVGQQTQMLELDCLQAMRFIP